MRDQMIYDLGLIDYKKAWDFQKEVFEKVRNGSLKSALIICSHNPVITLGRGAGITSLRVPESDIRSKNISVYPVDRGGDATYHGPGQILVYPVCSLKFFGKDLHYYLRFLEDFMIGALAEFNCIAGKKDGLTGLWIKDRKIASIGIAVRSWIAYHGVSINIKKNDLEGFSYIKPCGMDIEMSCLESVTARPIDMEQVKKVIIRRWKNDKSRFA